MCILCVEVSVLTTKLGKITVHCVWCFGWSSRWPTLHHRCLSSTNFCTKVSFFPWWPDLSVQKWYDTSRQFCELPVAIVKQSATCTCFVERCRSKSHLQTIFFLFRVRVRIKFYYPVLGHIQWILSNKP